MKFYRLVLIAGWLNLAAATHVRALSSLYGSNVQPLDSNCRLAPPVEASYTSLWSTYKIQGVCATQGAPIGWAAEGKYNWSDKQVTETIVVNGPSPHRGEIRLSIACAGDPWIVNPNAHHCSERPSFSASGEIATVPGLIADLTTHYSRIQRPLTAPTAGYSRDALSAKRQADLKAEAQLLASVQKASPYANTTIPTVRSPIAGQRFLNQTVVPIKLAPPSNWSVSLYMVNIQRKDNAGNWINRSSLPVGPAQAHSATGYTEFGAGGKDGRSLAFLTSPGAWRLNAQIAAPKQSSWSPWVEFGVMAPPTPSNALKPGRLR